MIRRIPAVVAGAAGLVVLAGTIGGGMVFAAANDTPPTPSTQSGRPPIPGDRQQRLDDYLNKLAANLGVTVDKLKGALKQTAVDQIDQAQKDGKLTADQAQKLKDALNSGTNVPLGPGFGGGMPGGRGPGGMAPNGQGKPMGLGGIMGMLPGAMNDLATFLNIPLAQLQQELQSGKSLAEVAGAHGKDSNALKTFLTTESNKQIDALVGSGKVTKDQGDQMKQAFTTNLDAMINAKMPQGMPFGGPHHGGPRPIGQSQPPQPGSSTSGASFRITS